MLQALADEAKQVCQCNSKSFAISSPAESYIRSANYDVSDVAYPVRGRELGGAYVDSRGVANQCAVLSSLWEPVLGTSYLAAKRARACISSRFVRSTTRLTKYLATTDLVPPVRTSTEVPALGAKCWVLRTSSTRGCLRRGLTQEVYVGCLTQFFR